MCKLNRVVAFVMGLGVWMSSILLVCLFLSHHRHSGASCLLRSAQFRYFVTVADEDAAAGLSALAQRMHLPPFELAPNADDAPLSAPSALASAAASAAFAADPADYDDADLDAEYTQMHLRRIALPVDPSPPVAAIAGSHVLRLLYALGKQRALPMLGLVAFATESAGAADGLALMAVAGDVLREMRGGDAADAAPLKVKVPLTWSHLETEPVQQSMYI